MSLDGDIALLKRVPLFGALPTEQLRLLAFSAVRLDLTEQQVLFREGSKATSGYVVSSGSIELSVSGGGDKRVLATCEVGALIGEIALFVDTKRPATAVALAPSQVLEIDRKQILRMLDEYPHIALRLRAVLAERLTATVSDLRKVRETLMAVDRRMPRR